MIVLLLLGHVWGSFMPFNQNGAFTSLNSKLLKLVNLFLYLGVNILSTESDIDICMGKLRTAIDTLTNISKILSFYKIKWDFWQSVVMSVLPYGGTTWNAWRKSKIGTTKECMAIALTTQVRRSRHAGKRRFQWTPMHRQTNLGWPEKRYIQQFGVDTGCCLQDLSRVMYCFKIKKNQIYFK